MPFARSTAAQNAVTLGVIGHVDHGKTALVRALTGVETDRLEEERARGLSIVLGFAYIDTPHGCVDLIDVPGHEAFIKAMIAGATALDGIVLCVAADEGVMPQTVEHFRIASLLGADRGLVVLTKTDLVDDDLLAARRDELARWLRGSFLERGPVLEVSAVSGTGLDAVRDALAAFAALPVEREGGGSFFMPLDRAFTMHGFGLVVTGTLRGGALGVGDAVEIVPSGRRSTVRALQNHGCGIERAVAGQRVAVNLRNLSRGQVARGDVLAAPGSIVPAKRIDVSLHVLDKAERPLGHGDRVRFSTGTTEAVATVRLLDRRRLEPGETAFAQLSLDRDVATRRTERLLLRSDSPLCTIAGGRVLDVDTKRHRRFDPSVRRRLESMASGDAERIVVQRLEEAGGKGMRRAALTEALGIGGDKVDEIVTRTGAMRVGENALMSRHVFDRLLTDTLAVIERFHRLHPLRTGIDAGSLSRELGRRTSPEVLQRIAQELIARRRIELSGEIYRTRGYDPFAKLGEKQRQLVLEIERAFLEGGLEPPPPETVVGDDRAARLLFGLLLETGRLVRLKTYDRNVRIVVHADTLERARQKITCAFPHPAEFAVKDVRDLLRTTRRHVVPLMEHFDATGVTVRNGVFRRLRQR